MGGLALRICIDVDELERGLAFSPQGLGLTQGRREQAWGRMANLADPYGHGRCLLEFRGRGYDALLEPGG